MRDFHHVKQSGATLLCKKIVKREWQGLDRRARRKTSPQGARIVLSVYAKFIMEACQTL